MKKISLILACVILIGCFTNCSASSKKNTEIIVTGIKDICELATYECYYNIVYRKVKQAEDGFTHLFEKDRNYWLEYTATVKIGIDMNDVNITVNDSNVTVQLPKAKLLGEPVIEDGSVNDNDIKSDKDSLNSNPITAEFQSEMYSEANKELKNIVSENTTLLKTGTDRAEKLIKKYIEAFGKAAGINYTVKFEYIETEPETTPENTEVITK